ncbi:uncharacterized protein CDV56_105796 [Aspergillus thermomutatus]|uniref:Uncharacterized protein n=1 Tax=Aspergillus thermomutatus TaxID=41047 RepID=A0A397HN07_ASPTH|nr:uncharacterized protein CDV56_105796 [Aspergillus thermomutatus]RHZ64432.1 hypothetical protein CDV56_105796 [Aspergillus thermomutatus]
MRGKIIQKPNGMAQCLGYMKPLDNGKKRQFDDVTRRAIAGICVSPGRERVSLEEFIKSIPDEKIMGFTDGEHGLYKDVNHHLNHQGGHLDWRVMRLLSHLSFSVTLDDYYHNADDEADTMAAAIAKSVDQRGEPHEHHDQQGGALSVVVGPPAARPAAPAMFCYRHPRTAQRGCFLPARDTTDRGFSDYWWRTTEARRQATCPMN